jgi:hypothetical protein
MAVDTREAAHIARSTLRSVVAPQASVHLPRLRLQEIAVRAHTRAEGTIGDHGLVHLGLTHRQPHHQVEAATAQPRDRAV